NSLPLHGGRARDRKTGPLPGDERLCSRYQFFELGEPKPFADHVGFVGAQEIAHARGHVETSSHYRIHTTSMKPHGVGGTVRVMGTAPRLPCVARKESGLEKTQ